MQCEPKECNQAVQAKEERASSFNRQIRPLGRFHISLLAQHRVNQVAITSNGSIQVAPFYIHFDLGFIYVPRNSSLSATHGTQLISHEWGKVRFPVSNRLMRERKAALEKHLGQIAQAQLLSKSPQHDEQNDI